MARGSGPVAEVADVAEVAVAEVAEVVVAEVVVAGAEAVPRPSSSCLPV